MTYMDGKGGAEELVAKLLKAIRALMQALSATPKPDAGSETDGRGRLIMADLKFDQDTTAETTEAQTMEMSEFEGLLHKEFKPKTDRAREAVQTAVQTLALHRRWNRPL